MLPPDSPNSAEGATLDPTPDEMRRLGHLAVDLAVEHWTTLRQRRVGQRASAAEAGAVIREPLPETGHGLESSLHRYFEQLLDTATFTNHPRFFAYVPGPGSFAGALGGWVAAATNLFVGTWLGGAGMAQLELEVLEWLRQALELPEGTTGVLTSGGSVANMSALAAARAHAGAPERGAVFTSEAAHYSFAKGARVIGLPEAAIRAVPTDARGRMRVDALRGALQAAVDGGEVPFCVCATAGTTSIGSIDPLTEIADLCAEFGVWLHVDGAYGAAVALLPEEREALAGIERADSLTLDPHKWLYAPFECGCLLTAHTGSLRRAFTADADYLQDVPRDEVNFFERGPELSRGNRALPLWMLLRSVGLERIRVAIRSDLRLCRLARDLIAADPRLEIVTEPQLSIFSFAVRGDEDASQRLVEILLQDGRVMLSSARVDGRFVLRFCVVNHRTSEDDIRAAVAVIRDSVAAAAE